MSFTSYLESPPTNCSLLIEETRFICIKNVQNVLSKHDVTQCARPFIVCAPVCKECHATNASRFLASHSAVIRGKLLCVFAKNTRPKTIPDETRFSHLLKYARNDVNRTEQQNMLRSRALFLSKTEARENNRASSSRRSDRIN